MSDDCLSTDIETELDRTTELCPPDGSPIQAVGSLEDGAVSMTVAGETNVQIVTGWHESDGNPETGIHLDCEIDGEGKNEQGHLIISFPLEIAEELSNVLAEHSN